MRKLKNTLVMLCMFIGLFVINPISADAATTYTSGDYEYIVVDNNVHIVSYHGKSSIVEIPSLIAGKNVTAIETLLGYDGAFEGNMNVKKIVVPPSIKFIGERAFLDTSTCAIYIENSNVEYEYTDYRNMCFGVVDDYRQYIYSTSGSSTERYYNDYYVKSYSEKSMQWNSWCSEVYYHNLDWSGPDSISFADTSDLTVESSSELGINYLYMPQVSLYDKEGNYMDGDSASNPFNDYGHVEFWVNRSPEANIPSGQTKFKGKGVYGDNPGMWSITFGAAGTYYVHPVYVRKARTDCLASLYVDEHFIIGEPIKVVVEKTRYVPNINSIHSYIEIGGLVNKREIVQGEVLDLDLPAYANRGISNVQFSLSVSSRVGSPVYDGGVYYMDEADLMQVTSSNEAVFSSGRKYCYSDLHIGMIEYSSLSLNNRGRSTVTLSNPYGYKTFFTVDVDFSYATKGKSYFSYSDGAAIVEKNKSYDLDDFIDVQVGHLIDGETKWDLVSVYDYTGTRQAEIDTSAGTITFLQDASTPKRVSIRLQEGNDYSKGDFLNLYYKTADKEDLSNSTKPGSDNNNSNNSSDSNDSSNDSSDGNNSNDSNGGSTDNNDGSPIFIGSEDLSDEDNNNAAGDKENKEDVKVSLNVSDTFTMQKGRTVAVKLMKSSKKGDRIKDVNVTGGSKIVTAKVSGNSIKVNAKKSGTAKIKITTNAGAEKIIKVKVSAKKVKPAISIKSKVSVKKGKSLKLEYALKKIPASGKVTFSSSNKKIATVGKTTGVIKGKKKGAVKITVKVDGKKVKTVKVNVK